VLPSLAGAAGGEGRDVIGSVRGTVVERSANGEVLVEVGGVGYRVNVPLRVVPALDPGSNAFLFTHLHVREDAMVLFGFPSRDERDTFEVLIGATGVGPKLALAILSVHTPNTLRRGLADDDLDALILVPGVGKRTAQRLLVELKSRLEVPDLDLVDVPGGATSARGEVRDALVGLGYSAEEVRTVLSHLDEDGTVEDLLRDALRVLAGSR
jgi:Holliday junction DNA helicase RuvA